MGATMTTKRRQQRKQRRQHQKARRALIRASAANNGIIHAAALELEWIKGEGEDDKQRRFRIKAYSGGAMRVGNYGPPIAIELSGMQASTPIPILLDHMSTQIVGHADTVNVGAASLSLDGVISGIGESADKVTAMASNGFPWRASVGVLPDEMEFVGEGLAVKVNGKRLKGPIYVARTSELKEVSFVAVAADSKTSAKVAANSPITKEFDMEFSQWLKAEFDLDAETLTEEQRTKFEAKWEASKEPDPDPETPPVVNATVDQPDFAARRALEAAEVDRIQAIRKVCAEYRPDVDETKVAEIEAAAIRDGEDKRDVELKLLRASRPKAPTIHSQKLDANAKVLECAIRLGSGDAESTLLARYGEDTMEAADPYRGLGIKGIIAACCQMEGQPTPRLGAGINDYITAGFSTASLATLLSNSANKTMMDAYTAIDSVAKVVSRKLSANDFKTHTGAQLTGDFIMKKVGATGEIKHAVAGDDSFTYTVETYARIFGITRQMMKNDDLGALMDIPRMLGRGAALALEDAFWTLVLANTGTFFGTGNSNYADDTSESVSTVLSSDTLGYAVRIFRQQTDPDGYPIKLAPKYLVVPPELETTADELYVSRNLQSGNTGKQPDANVFANKYEPKITPYLSNSSYTNYSALAWYLFGNPADIPAFGIAYLDGVETPVVEDAPLEGDILGQAWRGYLDFGVCQINHRGAVMVKGE